MSFELLPIAPQPIGLPEDAMTMSPSPTIHKVSVPECLARGGSLFKQRAFGAMGITLLAALLIAVAQGMASGAAEGAVAVSCDASGACGATKAVVPALIALVAAGSILPLVAGFGLWFLRAGRGERANAGTAFAGFPHYIRLAFGSVIAGLIKTGPASIPVLAAAVLLDGLDGTPIASINGVQVIGLIAAGMGAFYVLYMTAALIFWPLVVVDQRVGAIQAISISAQLMQGNKIRLYFLFAVLGVINGAALVFPPALLATVPFSAAAVACFYDRLVVANAGRLNLQSTTGELPDDREVELDRIRREYVEARATSRRHLTDVATEGTASTSYDVVGAGYVTLPAGVAHPAERRSR